MDDKLYKFSRLAEAGSYTKAAKQLHISQPALTIAIQKLERELGAPLLIRTGKRLELTAAGEAVYQAALEHQDIAKNLASKLHHIANKRPAFSIGMVDSVAEKICVTPAFEALEAIADVTVVVNNSRYLREALEHRKLNCALVISDGREHDGLLSQTIGNEQLQLVVAPSLQPLISEGLARKQLLQFISYDRPSTTYTHIQRHFMSEGIITHTRLFSTSPNVILNMVIQKKGCAVLPHHMVENYLKTGQLTSLLPPFTRPIVCRSIRNNELPLSLITFLKAAKHLL